MAHPVENPVEGHCVKVHTEVFEICIDDLVGFRTARTIPLLASKHLFIPIFGLFPPFFCSCEAVNLSVLLLLLNVLSC